MKKILNVFNEFSSRLCEFIRVCVVRNNRETLEIGEMHEKMFGSCYFGSSVICFILLVCSFDSRSRYDRQIFTQTQKHTN